MKLAVVTHNVIRGDGQGRVAYEIARHALEQGHHVSLLADRVEPDLQALGAAWVPIQPRFQRVNLPKVWEFARRTRRVLARSKGAFDVVQAFGFVLDCPHQVNTAQFVHHAWRRSPVHTFRLRKDFYGLYQWTYTLLNARWERRAYRQAQVVVAASGQVRRELIVGGVPEERIRVILNATDPEEFRPGRADRAALALPENVPLALFAGDIRTPRKNLDTALKAMISVPGIHLAVVGAVAGSPYPKMAEKLGVSERVHFLDFRRDMARIMQAVDMFVFPSRYEPFGIVVLEAMASGVPVITAGTVGASELVTPECGIVIADPDDVPALAAAMLELRDDPPRRRAMGQAARQIAERHTWTNMAEAYLTLYQEVST